MVILSHPTGNANVRAAAIGLKQSGLLLEFNTSIALFESAILNSLGKIAPEICRRSFDSNLRNVTRTYPWKEVGRLLALKYGINGLTTHEKGFLSIDSIYRSIDKSVAKHLKKGKKAGASSVYAYEDAALSTFTEGRRLGLKCLYDLPIGYWRKAKQLLEVECQKWPEWQATLTSFSDSEVKLSRKDYELSLADTIFVASRFTAQTLLSFPGNLAPIKVIPYGFPPVLERRNYRNLLTKKRLKILFVGGLSQRKGIANLFAAVASIGSHVELTVIGNKINNGCHALDMALEQHTWIPSLPHSRVLQLMSEHDVLVFPSLFEGFGLVITEAMSQGTPVITTDRTAGPDLIEHGENGWIIEAGSTNSLILAIEELLNKPKIVEEAGKAAMNTAKLRPWKVYGAELAQAIVSS